MSCRMTNDIEMVTRHCNPTMKSMHVMPQLFVLSATKLKVWSKLLPVPAAHHERAKRSWLISKSNGKIGCIACKNFPANDAVREDRFATCQIDSVSVQLCRLRKPSINLHANLDLRAAQCDIQSACHVTATLRISEQTHDASMPIELVLTYRHRSKFHNVVWRMNVLNQCPNSDADSL